jgi:hypothetical protein
MMNNPQVSWEPIYNPANNDVEAIVVTIPADEQYKLPVWTDIKMIMNIEWTSLDYSEYKQPGTFQNVMYTIQLSP